MLPFKNKVINKIIEIEGGYVNDPSDSGGETNFGITLNVARENGYKGDMRELPRFIAFGIYEDKYWKPVKGDQIEMMSKAVVEELVDTAVNMGVYRAGTFLQRSLNVLNNGESLFKDLKVDGDIGLATLTALRNYVKFRDDQILARAMNCLQGAFYIELAERREKDERFVYGWMKHRIGL